MKHQCKKPKFVADQDGNVYCRNIIWDGAAVGYRMCCWSIPNRGRKLGGGRYKKSNGKCKELGCRKKSLKKRCYCREHWNERQKIYRATWKLKKYVETEQKI